MSIRGLNCPHRCENHFSFHNSQLFKLDGGGGRHKWHEHTSDSETTKNGKAGKGRGTDIYRIYLQNNIISSSSHFFLSTTSGAEAIHLYVYFTVIPLTTNAFSPTACRPLSKLKFSNPLKMKLQSKMPRKRLCFV